VYLNNLHYLLFLKLKSGRGAILRISNEKFGILCSIPGLIALLALIFYPVVYVIIVSFLRYNNITPIRFTGLKNYIWLFLSADFYISWKISTIYSLGSTGFTFILALLLAHSLHKITKGKTLFRTLAILSWAVPLILSGFMWKWILNRDIGVLNYLLSSVKLINNNLPFLSDPKLAMLSGILATAFSHTPFMTVLLLAGLESIPHDLYEVAQIDGADHLQRFWYISIPLNKSQMIVGSLIIGMFTFRTPDIFFSLTYGGPGKATYHAGLFLMDTIYRYLNFGHASAISVMLFITIVAFVFPVLYYGVMKRSSS